MILEILLGTLLFTLGTYLVARVWHLGAFKKQYEKWKYFDKNINKNFVVLSIIIQGLILSGLYYYFVPNKASISSAITFVGIMGTFFWTSHVLIAMAKNKHLQNQHFFVFESIYLTLKYWLFGLLLVALYAII